MLFYNPSMYLEATFLFSVSIFVKAGGAKVGTFELSPAKAPNIGSVNSNDTALVIKSISNTCLRWLSGLRINMNIP